MLWQAAGMATKHDLKDWVVAAVSELGPSTVVEVSRWVWDHHEGDLRTSGPLFYTWQYDLRWAAMLLRKEGRLAPVARGGAARWRLS